MVTAAVAGLLAAWWPAAAAAGDGFVLIRGAEFMAGDVVTSKGERVRLDDFEILDHPLTNEEYAIFVREARFPPPPHWRDGRIPAGMEKMPVVFVNRYDAEAYLAWRTKKDGRNYRLPTSAEFEYASRGGLERKKYPWGDEEPDASRANLDPKLERNPTEWGRYLKPVKSYPPNGYKLYDMAGNVWQITTMMLEPGRTGDKYRASAVDIERTMLGGSWLRSAPYLRCGNAAYHSPGTRHPDVGFRPVREPRGSTSFQTEVRRLAGVPQGAGRVYLSWAFLPRDASSTGFNIYRTRRRDTAGFRVNDKPVADSTNYLDSTAVDGALQYYRVRPVDGSGREGPPSEWFGVKAGPATGVLMEFRPLARPGGINVAFGDLDGDGRQDCVFKFNNGLSEGALDPGVPVELEGWNSDSRQLWRRPLVHADRIWGNSSNVPVAVADFNGDGKGEVATLTERGYQRMLTLLDGWTGREIRSVPWPPMLTDEGRSSMRLHLAPARLDGKNTAIVTQTGLYENEVITAFDGNLRQLWEFRSTMETSGSAGHRLKIADIDLDGKDEVFDGSTLLNHDGSVRWSIHRGHADITDVGYILPGGKALQVFFGIETLTHAGVYVVDALTGKIHWKLTHEEDPRWWHTHRGWAAEIWQGSPGMELVANRDGHATQDIVVLTAEGRILAEGLNVRYTPIEWDGDPVRELMTANGETLSKFDGKRFVPIPGSRVAERPRSSCSSPADRFGDFRDEILCTTPAADGRFGIQLYMPTAVIHTRALSNARAQASEE
ncbi:MAG: SUMF1/EgtB/PvdO family nonheme iron enzyme [Bryobacteraceae bacterium]